MTDSEDQGDGSAPSPARIPAAPRIALINPNTSIRTTDMLAGIASRLLPAGVTLEAHTTLHGPLIISNAAELAQSARQIVPMAQALVQDGVDAILIAGFGDPGLADLRQRVHVPVTGIAEAGMAEAAADGRRFSIITTTPDLEAPIRALAQSYGYGAALASLRLTPGPLAAVMATPDGLARALIDIAQDCAADGAQAVLIGGGPLAGTARAVSAAIPLPVIDPVSAGVRLTLRRLGL